MPQPVAKEKITAVVPLMGCSWAFVQKEFGIIEENMCPTPRRHAAAAENEASGYAAEERSRSRARHDALLNGGRNKAYS